MKQIQKLGFTDGSRIVGSPVTKSFQISYAQLADTPIVLMYAQEGDLILDALVEITTKFEGTGPTLDVGDEDTEDGFLADTNISEDTLGWYGADTAVRGAFLYDGTKKSLRKLYTEKKAIQVAIGGTDLTAGVANIYITLIRQKP
ncbi:unnamed protein product [marine sediment metagenome]|uniref:Uncharacterized protein n=1 Tax=marine sediment metagenome TaxID=412755 RepID=X1JHD8_9ZZZZ